MAITKTVNVGGSDVVMRASALIPRLYRAKFGRDMIRDLMHLKESFSAAKDDPENSSLSVLDLTIFENVAWLMARHANTNAIPDSPDLWLDSIDGVFSIYEVLPQILELWSENLATTSVPVKK